MTGDRERFESKIFYCTVTGCWLWTRCTNSNGYGQARFGGKTRLAHRVSYELHIGPLPDGLVIDHLCRTRNCVNPDHLRAVAQSENLHAPGSLSLPSLNAARSHCPRGHEHVEWNCVRAYSRKGWRSCLACSQARGWGRSRGFGSDSEMVAQEADRRYRVLMDAALATTSQLSKAK